MMSFHALRVTAGLVLLVLVLGAGLACRQTDSAPAATPAPTQAPTEISSPTPSPGPTTVTKVWNITRNLSGLEMILTLAHWTGDTVVAEWVLTNRSGEKFEKDYLNDILSIGVIAKDQDGREGEYFVPLPFTRDLARNQMVTMESTWVFQPESKVIALRLRDIREPEAGIHVDDSVVFVFTR